MAAGSWEIDLRDDTPFAVTSGVLNLSTAQYGHVVITSVRLTDSALTAAAIKAVARYSGVYRGIEGPRHTTLHGAGLTLWISDEDGKDDKVDTDVADYFGNTNWNTLAGLVPAALTAGTTSSVPGSAYTATNKANVTRKKALDDAAAFFAAEYRVNPNFTMDSGAETTLYPTIFTPTVAFLSATAGFDGGRDLNIKGFLAEINADLTAEDLTTMVVITDNTGASVGVAGGSHATLKDPNGNALHLRRLEQSDQVASTSGNAAATAQLNRFLGVTERLVIDVTGVHDLGLDVKVGDWVFVYSPDGGVIDAASQIYYRGQVIYPEKARVQAMTWPVAQGMGVYFLQPTASPVPFDLTDYVDFQDSKTTVEVGAPERQLPFGRKLGQLGFGL